MENIFSKTSMEVFFKKIFILTEAEIFYGH